MLQHQRKENANLINYKDLSFFYSNENPYNFQDNENQDDKEKENEQREELVRYFIFSIIVVIIIGCIYYYSL